MEIKLNEQQEKAAEHMDGPCLVTSVPGSGKSATLVERVSRLIKKGVSPKNILCITFTNKAGNEMRERICKNLNVENPGFYIGTFHSLCAKLLRKIGPHCGQPSNFSIIDDKEQASLINQIARQLNYTVSKDDLYFVGYWVNNFRDQLQSFSFVEEKLKSECQIEIAKEYLKKCKKSNFVDFSGLIYNTIKILEDNPNIKDKLQDIFKYILVDETQDTNGSQYHLINLLGEKHKNIMLIGDIDQCVVEGEEVLTDDGYKPIEEIKVGDKVKSGNGFGIEDRIVLNVFKKHVQNYEIVTIKTESGYEATFSEEHTVFSESCSEDNNMILDFNCLANFSVNLFYNICNDKFYKHNVSIECNMDRNISYAEDFIRFIKNTINIKDTKCNYFCDFYTAKEKERTLFNINFLHNDMGKIYEIFDYLNTFLDNRVMLKEHINLNEKTLTFMPSSFVTEGSMVYVEKYGVVEAEKVVSVEFDTYSGNIYDIDVEENHNFVTGGIFSHNSIYAFRGAKYKNLKDFIDKYSDCKVYSLSKNYRSTPQIIAVADKLIKKNVKSHLNGVFETDNPDGMPVKARSFSDQLEEAEWVARKIKVLKDDKGYDLNNIVILYRMNKMSEPFEQIFARSGIPYEVIGAWNFYDRKEVKDCLAMLKMIANKRDGISFHRICSIVKNIGDTTVGSIENYSEEKDVDILESVKEMRKSCRMQRTKKACQKIIDIYDSEFDTSNPSLIMSYFVNEFKYFDYLKKNYEENYKERIDNVNQLIEAMSRFDNAPNGVQRYLEAVSLITSIDKENEKIEDKVTLMSLHAAKGLEFDIVFMVGVEDGILPHAKALNDTDNPQEAIEEERRLAYVGITRAKKMLFVSHCESRAYFDKSRKRKFRRSLPSKFLYESGLKKKVL